MSLIYFAVDMTALEDEHVWHSENSGATTLKQNIAGTKVIVKFTPENAPVNLLNKGYGPYSAAEMRQYLIDNASDWDDA